MKVMVPGFRCRRASGWGGGGPGRFQLAEGRVQISTEYDLGLCFFSFLGFRVRGLGFRSFR